MESEPKQTGPTPKYEVHRGFVPQGADWGSLRAMFTQFTDDTEAYRNYDEFLADIARTNTCITLARHPVTNEIQGYAVAQEVAPGLATLTDAVVDHDIRHKGVLSHLLLRLRGFFADRNITHIAFLPDRNEMEGHVKEVIKRFPALVPTPVEQISVATRNPNILREVVKAKLRGLLGNRRNTVPYILRTEPFLRNKRGTH